MIASALVLAALAADPPPPASPSAEDRAAYATAAAAAGRDARAHVRLAVWCEARGMAAERLKHLGLAALADPANAAARGLMGLVRDGDAWRRPEQVAAKIRGDAKAAEALAEYHRRRERVGKSADEHWRLAAWCEENGLEAEAKAHLAAVVRIDPRRDAAWKKLGCKKHHGRWMTPEQIAAQIAEAEAQKKADRTWPERLAKWKGGLKDRARREEAEAALAGVTDPRAVRSVWKVFGGGSADDQARAVQVLGQIDGPAASRALATLAVGGKSEAVRRTATETLRGRDPRDVLGLLIGLVEKPLRYEVRPVGGPGSPGALFVEGRRVNVRRLYDAPAAQVALQPGDSIDYDEYGLPVIVRLEGVQRVRVGEAAIRDQAAAQQRQLAAGAAAFAGQAATPEARRAAGQVADSVRGATVGRLEQAARDLDATKARAGAAGRGVDVEQDTPVFSRIPVGQMQAESRRAAAAAQKQLEDDIAAIDAYNAKVRETTARIVATLSALTGQDLGDDRDRWQSWWADRQGYAYSPTPERPRPTVVQEVAPAYQPRTDPIQLQGGVPTFQVFLSHSCFAAGTPVQTIAGPAPIESIRVGDRVLTQDTKTGALGYQPVLAVAHNKPAPTLRISLGGETIVATGIHRFWKAGRGWTMARDLRPGDAVRTVGGVARVAKVEEDRVQPVFNLEVASARSFFVGDAAALVHDNSLVEPTSDPFDAPPALARGEAAR